MALSDYTATKTHLCIPFHIHVSVSDLYSPRIGYIFPPAEKADRSLEYIITHRRMNVDIETEETPIFLFWEYLFQNFGILSLQCSIVGLLLLSSMAQGSGVFAVYLFL